MNQTIFNLRLNVNEVKRLTAQKVQVWASRGNDMVSFQMYTSEGLGPKHANDTPKVNDDILVTITTPAPELDDIG